MNKVFFGVLLVVGSSWIAMVAYPYFALGGLQPETSEETGGLVPPALRGNALAGHTVYASNGCVYCHSQYVRPAPEFTDIAKGLGKRQTVPRDYLRLAPAFLGIQRAGSDLSNVAVRQPDAAYYFRVLYEPDVVQPGSNMPAYRFLFDERKIQGQRSELAVDVQGPYRPKPGYEIVPKDDARVLVSYLLSLNRDYPLPEAPPVAEE